jgi:pimeloyl-ACP methyl ester carboxylesterase
MLHEPSDGQPERGAVLLCKPMGQEAIRGHRAFSVLANRLARTGFRTLSFDCFGTGDSCGGDTEGDLDGWIGDVLSADAVLRHHAASSLVVWFGLRLGATLGAIASGRAQTRPDALVLVDPIVDGPAYLRELASADRRAQLQGFAANLDRYREIQQSPLPDVPAEVLGYELSQLLQRQLLSLNERVFDAMRARCATVAWTAQPDALRDALVRARRAGVEVESVQLRHPVDWATNDGGGSTIVPNELVAVTLSAVEGAVT